MFVDLNAIGGRGEPNGIQTVVERAEPDAEFVRVFGAVAFAELMQNGIGCVVPHAGADVQGVVVVGEFHRGSLTGIGTGVGGILDEVLVFRQPLPAEVIQVSVQFDGLFEPRTDGLTLSPSPRCPQQTTKKNQQSIHELAVYPFPIQHILPSTRILQMLIVGASKSVIAGAVGFCAHVEKIVLFCVEYGIDVTWVGNANGSRR